MKLSDMFDKLLSEGLKENNFDIDFVYNQHPMLNDIGKKEDYIEYLKTIFPNSKVKGVYYHASPNEFTEFKDPYGSALSHIWFSENPITGQFGSKIYSVVLNITNPLNEKDVEYSSEIRKYENPINPNWVNNHHITGELPKFKYDGTIRDSRVTDGWDVTVRNPKQIHILGLPKDIEGFKKYLKKCYE